MEAIGPKRLEICDSARERCRASRSGRVGLGVGGSAGGGEQLGVFCPRDPYPCT